ncbi:unconventional myosin-IXa isoform X1 [Pelobates cultripes]|uniref:Unconventional myosin-IXa isoform X1 n=1 Tax=Pelobates cultripes TaxID=61616 RepID=A0AAD1RLB5_PELCU|nr:unconventional myosin-IXa isoform X1 [Pelobates cultripes]
MSEVGGGGGRRRLLDEDFTLQVYPGSISPDVIYCPVPARWHTTAADVIDALITALRLDRSKFYVLAEVKEFGGEEWILNPTDYPAQRMMLWPRLALEARGSGEDYRFLLREKNMDGSIHYGSLQSWLKVTEERRRMVERGFLPQQQGPECEDLCVLPDLSERVLLETLRTRFRQEKIYTYVGSILVAVNPFRFLPIYNPKYVKMYDNRRLGEREPHIYAVADAAYHAMLRRQRNQCIVISGETGSGKTQSTNFLIHHLTALSQKGYASGVEQIILGAGPVLEAFGNAKTSQNNNSSRFGKFIQVNYHETGTVRGAYVEKYLLEKSRLVYQEQQERNYHVFYYLLAGASEEEKTEFHLQRPENYHYLGQKIRKPHRQGWGEYDGEDETDSLGGEGEDLRHDFERLQLAMEMVGFLAATRKQIVSLLSAILHLGNIQYKRKTYRDEYIDISNPEALSIVSELLKVREEMLLDALITRKTVTVGEKLILPYRLPEAITVRDSLAKSLYSALFDWIVFRINHALLNINSKALEDSSQTLSIGVLDIFGFEDYGSNSFEQFCINYANERLQHYFNQHLFQLEQELYRSEGISWSNINYSNNEGCINLISKRPTGLIQLLDEESNFPQATHQTLLEKFKRHHDGNPYIEFPAVMEPAFIIQHYAGKVKYGVKDFREKNTDHMRPDIVALLRSSRNAFIRGMIAISPVAAFRWALLRAVFRAMWAFRQSGRNSGGKKTGSGSPCTPGTPGSAHKGLSSFSFLQHPVHQRSLQILQRCQNDQYNIPRRTPRTPLSDLQGVNTIQERSPRELNWAARRQSRLSSSSSYLEGGGIFISSPGSNLNSSSDSKLLERAHGILMRNRNSKSKPTLPKHLLDVKSLKHLSNLTLHDRITKSLLHLHKKKKPPSISAQFQASLNKLMETLGQAEPYFVKCIRSNAEKVPLRFNDALVLRQLRYTGMLETVRIRQSGYSCKYPFQDFVTQFSVLLPKAVAPVRQNIQEFFWRIGHSPDQYQVGKTMVFLKEQERQCLRDMLHQTVLQRIILLQRWMRAMLQRKRFLQLKEAAITIQRCWRHYKRRWDEEQPLVKAETVFHAAVIIQTWWRCHMARYSYLQRKASAVAIQNYWREHWLRRQKAALCIQSTWRGYIQRRRYQCQRKHIVGLQAACRGYIARRRFLSLKQMKTNCFIEDHGAGDSTPPASTPDVEHRKWEDLEITDPNPPESVNTEDIQSVDEIPAEVHIRERPKSLENPNQRKVVRAKRESRRMRELEQAQFSLELLKVRSGGMSPSEERRWSAEILLDKHPGTPESEGSLGSLELISCDENQHFSEDRPTDMISPDIPLNSPTDRLLSTTNEAFKDSSSSDIAASFTYGTVITPSHGSLCSPSQGPSTSPIYSPKSNTSNDPALHSFPEPLSTHTSRPISSPSHGPFTGFTCEPSQSPKTTSNSDLPGQSNSHSNGIVGSFPQDTSGSPKNLKVPSNGPMCSPTKVTSSGLTPNELTSNHASSPSEEVSSELLKKSSHHPPSPVSEAVDISWGSSTSWRQKPPGLDMSESAPAKLSVPTFYRTHPRDPLLSSSLPTFYVPNQESLRLQEQNETGEAPTNSVLHRLQKLNEEKEELQKQVQQQKERQMMEQIRKEKQELERQRKMQEQQESTGESQSSPDITMRTSKKPSDRPQSLLLQSPHYKGPPSKPPLEIKGLTVGGKSGPASNNSRPLSMFLEQRGGKDTKWDGVAETNDALRRPWLHNSGKSSIFFNPKGNASSDSENISFPPNRGMRVDPAKRLDATEPSGVSEAPHRRKARMARTRSDFLTRGALGGENSEDDSDEQGGRVLHADPAEETGTLSQACHSDSEMMLQKVQGGGRQSKLQKAISQGEMPRDLATNRTPEPDTRPQKGKIRFWGKTKAAEKLTPQSEVVEMDTEPSGREGSSAIHYTDVDTGLWLVPHSPDLSRGREKENKDPSPKVQRRRSLKISSAALEPAQWQDERAQIICSANDLKCMDEFLQKKIGDLDSEDGKKDSMVDVLFKRALKEFRQNIFNLYSTSLVGEDGKSIRYKDLGSLFEQILDKTMRHQQSRSWPESPVQVWINTFKVFLDEFVTEYKPLNYTSGKIQKPERKKRRKKESDIVEEHNGHVFKATQYNIPTYCEFCSSLIWIMDRAAVCKLCRYACHKKCCSQIITPCSKKYDLELSPRHFGVELSRLTNEERTVPVLLEKLIGYIEMHGLYTEGIYRKPGSTNKIRELRQSLDTDIDSVNLDDYNIHVIASVFKQWLRELPNPLMTFELYEEFLKSMGLGERKETVLGVYSIIDQLSRTHLSTLERLIFHLVRIAQQEDTNRMSANALAIVFAPCILRCPDTTDPLQSVQDIGKTTACVELIVMEQMNKYKARLKDINSLEFAESRAKSRLSLIRRSMGKGRLRSSLSPVISGLSTIAPDAATDHMLSNIPSEEESAEQKEAAMQQEERVLAQQIETLQKEKEELAYEMLALEPRASDDETLESEASLGTADSSENLNYESEGAVPTRAERSLVFSSARTTRSEPTRTRKQVKRDADSTDGGDRNLSSPIASSCLPHLGRKRFHLHPKSPFYRALGESREPSNSDYQDPGAPVHFTSRGTFNPEKGRQKLKNVKQSPQRPREPLDSGEQRILGQDGSSQSLVLFGSNEFMV